MPEPPECLAFVVCESVVEDKQTRNKCILNTYNRIGAFSFPTTQDRLTVFATLTNGNGSVDCTIRLVKDGHPQKEVFKLGGPMKFADPMQYVDVVVDFRGVRFEEPGVYQVELIIAGDLVAQRRLEVVQMPPPKGRVEGG